MKVSVSRRCAAAPDVVWAWLADPVRHERTLPGSIVDCRKQRAQILMPANNLSESLLQSSLVQSAFESHAHWNMKRRAAGEVIEEPHSLLCE